MVWMLVFALFLREVYWQRWAKRQEELAVIDRRLQEIPRVMRRK